MSDVRDDLTEVLALLVDDPREVVVTDAGGGHAPRLEVQVADGDLGKVIGRQGRTARAMRQVLTARTVHGDRAWELKILDN